MQRESGPAAVPVLLRAVRRIEDAGRRGVVLVPVRERTERRERILRAVVCGFWCDLLRWRQLGIGSASGRLRESGSGRGLFRRCGLSAYRLRVQSVAP